MHRYESLNPEQHFPTYRFLRDDNRDIALAEYNAANQSYQNKEKVYTTSSNIAILVISVVGSVLLGTNNDFLSHVNSYSKDWPQLFLMCSLNFFIVVTFLTYFAQRQREITFGARKVVILRRLLGVSYGKVHMILPTWRLEGCDEPLAIRSFRGWSDYMHFPVYLIVICSSFSFVFLFAQNNCSTFFLTVIASIYFGYSLYLYRALLYDDHENLWSLVSGAVAKILRVQMVGNFEYITYRAKLQVYEINRFGVDFDYLIKSLIFLEDRTFMTHIGISFRGMARAILNYFRYGMRSGGSTITQQLVRTLYIEDFSSGWRRKIVEVFLALWAERAFEKQDIIFMHLGAVRFEKDCFGVLDSMKFFFGKIIQEPSKAQAFFLIERISNVHSKFLSRKIYVNIKQAYENDFFTDGDIVELLGVYKDKIADGLLIEDRKGAWKKFEEDVSIMLTAKE